jgi:transcriptional regulator with XRE-family HTH domain
MSNDQTTVPVYDVGSAVRARRQRLGLTQAEVVAKTTLPDSNAISRIENGSDLSEQLGRLEQVARALGVTLPELLADARTGGAT